MGHDGHSNPFVNSQSEALGLLCCGDRRNALARHESLYTGPKLVLARRGVGGMVVDGLGQRHEAESD